MRTTIKDWTGRILGYINVDSKGNKTAFDFYNKIVGYYKADRNVTTDFYNRPLAKGDLCEALVYNSKN